jgi:hypothetical protein
MEASKEAPFKFAMIFFKWDVTMLEALAEKQGKGRLNNRWSNTIPQMIIVMPVTLDLLLP